MSVDNGHVNREAQVSVASASVVIKVLEEHRAVNDSFGKWRKRVLSGKASQRR